MPIFRGTVAFEWSSGGWTENFWLDTADRDQAVVRLRSYVTQRRKSLTQVARVTSVRAANPDPPRDSLFYPYLGDTGAGTDGLPPGNDVAEPLQAAANIRLQTADGRWRNLLVRGLPTTAILSGTRDQQINPNWFDHFNNVREVLVNSEFRIRRSTYPDAAVDITAVGISNGRIFSFSTAAPIPGNPTIGDRLQVRFNANFANANGLWQLVLPPVANTYHVRQKRALNQGQAGLAMGIIRKVTYEYVAIADLRGVRGTSKKVGRPFAAPRGRRSARRS